MKFTFSIREAGLGVIILIILAGCSSEPHSGNSQDIASVPRTTIDSLNLLVGPETSQNISRPSSISMLPNGKLAMLDTRLNKILLFDSEGELDTSFGKRGKGPGEFVAPRLLQVRDSTINVVDVVLQRVNQFNIDGKFIRNYPLERETSHFRFVTTGDSMEYYTVANGHNGKLVGHHNAATEKARYFGEAVVNNPPPPTDKKAFVNSVANGKIPAAIRNDLVMEFRDGKLYVFLKNMSRLQKYKGGNLIWDKKLALPVNDAIFANFAEDVQSGSSAFGVLRYIEDITATSDHVYLLWNGTSEHPQTIVEVNSKGDVQKIYKLPSSEKRSFRNLAVDSENQIVYLSDSRAARIYTAKLN